MFSVTTLRSFAYEMKHKVEVTRVEYCCGVNRNLVQIRFTQYIRHWNQ